MWINVLIFVVALGVLIVSSDFFTDSASAIGNYLKLPAFVVGVFIVGIGTSLPELVSGILSVVRGYSEVLSGNVIGANISNLLLVTGFALIINRNGVDLGKTYIFIDLNFLLGSFFYLALIAFDGKIEFFEAMVGIVIFLIYSYHLLKDNKSLNGNSKELIWENTKPKPPRKDFIVIAVAAVGIYFGADYTITSLTEIAEALHIPSSIIALTLLSLGTTLPELAVNISAIRKGRANMAIGNVLGSCISNTLLIPSIASFFGSITVPQNLLSFSLPVMLGAGTLFYLLAQDKRISVSEGYLFFSLYVLFLVKIVV